MSNKKETKVLVKVKLEDFDEPVQVVLDLENDLLYNDNKRVELYNFIYDEINIIFNDWMWFYIVGEINVII